MKTTNERPASQEQIDRLLDKVPFALRVAYVKQLRDGKLTAVVLGNGDLRLRAVRS